MDHKNTPEEQSREDRAIVAALGQLTPQAETLQAIADRQNATTDNNGAGQ